MQAPFYAQGYPKEVVVRAHHRALTVDWSQLLHDNPQVNEG